MKCLRLVLVLLLVLGLLCCTGACSGMGHESKVFPNMKEYRNYRLGLPEQPESFCLVAVGDVMLSRYVARVSKEQNDPGYPFAQVKWFFQGADLVFGNLENPITPGREIMIQEMTLRADPEAALALKDVGFTILSLANNHLLDFGELGVRDTMYYLDSVGIDYVGAGRNQKEAYGPKYVEVKGVKVALLAFNDPVTVLDNYMASDTPGIAVAERAKVTAAVQEAASNADFTVVYLHVGTEYCAQPDDTQVSYAHLAIDGGADVVLGSHPHVVQPVEKYRGKYIFYSLGNFIFDQLWSRETRESVVAKIYVRNRQVEKVAFLPVYIDDDARPVPLTGQEGQAVLNKLGLEFDCMIIPAWDNETSVFTTAEQFVFQHRQWLPGYRLTQRRQFDLDGDGIPEEFHLNNGVLSVYSGSHQIWQSPDDWWVDYFFLGDVNNDGIDELNLLVWKEGSFGAHKPFWLEEEDTSVKNHLFIFKMEQGMIKPVWQSSNLDYPNYQAQLVDFNGDSVQEMLVLEGSYTDPVRRQMTLWQWNGWGFSLIGAQSE